MASPVALDAAPRSPLFQHAGDAVKIALVLRYHRYDPDDTPAEWRGRAVAALGPLFRTAVFAAPGVTTSTADTEALALRLFKHIDATVGPRKATLDCALAFLWPFLTARGDPYGWNVRFPFAEVFSVVLFDMPTPALAALYAARDTLVTMRRFLSYYILRRATGDGVGRQDAIYVDFTEAVLAEHLARVTRRACDRVGTVSCDRATATWVRMTTVTPRS